MAAESSEPQRIGTNDAASSLLYMSSPKTGAERSAGRNPSSSQITTSHRMIPRRQRKIHNKVKTGCSACKARRQKCDERTPKCSACSRYSTECSYRTRRSDLHEQRRTSLAKSGTGLSPYCLPTQGSSTTPTAVSSFEDLELLHQFLTSTCIATAQLPEVTAHMQASLFPLAQEYPFVMHGVFAMAATHLSRLRPSRQAHYAMVAARNHQIALPRFQSCLQNINEKSCQALISYAKMLLWCSMASDAASNYADSVPQAGKNWLPQWFRLLRGSCYIVESSRAWIKKGPHVLVKLEDDETVVPTPDDIQMSNLEAELIPMTDSRTCQTVLAALREAFIRASMHHHNTPVRSAMNFWVGAVPEDYLESLQAKKPWALVILAHFCVLVHRFETMWFMKGHAARLLLSITEFLTPDWRQYIRWPCKELGIAEFA